MKEQRFVETASRGTAHARRFWYRWGNPVDRYVHKALKEDRATKRNDARGNVSSILKSISVDADNEIVDEVLTKVFNRETSHARWYNFC